MTRLRWCTTWTLAFGILAVLLSARTVIAAEWGDVLVNVQRPQDTHRAAGEAVGPLTLRLENVTGADIEVDVRGVLRIQVGGYPIPPPVYTDFGITVPAYADVVDTYGYSIPGSYPSGTCQFHCLVIEVGTGTLLANRSYAVVVGDLETCNGEDDDGDGDVDEGFTDADGDGFASCVDCDDTDPTVHPGVWEDPDDGIDTDCDGTDATGLDVSDAAFLGEDSGDAAGNSVAHIGDVDGDGLGDVLLGARYNADGGTLAGKAYLVPGSTILAGGDVDLSNIATTFTGEDAGDWAGYAVALAGDVDGDGLNDILIGAPKNDDGGMDAGKTGLYFGSTLLVGGAFDLGSADAVFVGEAADDYSGYSVASAGDVDGDGLDDILIGAVYGGGADEYGKAYLFFGSTIQGGGTFDLSSADASFRGEHDGDEAGDSVASAGDVDGDGLDDILIGAPGASIPAGDHGGNTYLMFGSTILGGGTFLLSSADVTFEGEETHDYSGDAVDSAGDVDGDGLDDILIGAPSNDEGDYSAGKSYLLLGSTIQAGDVTNLSAAHAAFIGEDAYDYAGEIASAGDVDGDGADDVLIGAWSNFDGGDHAGKIYLVLASTFQGGGSFDLSGADAAFVGEAGYDYLDQSGGAGDVNGDGLDDLLLGARGNDEAGLHAGKCYVLLSQY